MRSRRCPVSCWKNPSSIITLTEYVQSLPIPPNRSWNAATYKSTSFTHAANYLAEMRDHQHLPDEDGSLCAPESKPPSFQHPGNPGDSSLRLEDPRWWQGTFDRFFLFGTDNLDTIVLDMHIVICPSWKCTVLCLQKLLAEKYRIVCCREIVRSRTI